MTIYIVELLRLLIVSYQQQVLLATQVFAVFCIRESPIPHSGNVRLYAIHCKFGVIELLTIRVICCYRASERVRAPLRVGPVRVLARSVGQSLPAKKYQKTVYQVHCVKKGSKAYVEVSRGSGAERAGKR
jgi:hypothetical protein